MKNKTLIIGAALLLFFFLRKKKKGSILISDLDEGDFIDPVTGEVITIKQAGGGTTKGQQNSGFVDAEVITTSSTGGGKNNSNFIRPI